MQKMLIIFGLLLIVMGLAWPLLSHLKLGRLPGDIILKRGNTIFYFPITTCLVLSTLWVIISWIIQKWKS